MESQQFFSDKLLGQRPLFSSPSLNPVSKVKAAIKQAIKGCGLSREQIVDEMNRLAKIENIHVKVSLSLLDKWVAQEATHIIPWKVLPIFCRVTGSILPLQALVAPLGATVITGKDLKLLEWAKVEIKRRELSRKTRQLLEEIRI
ncbi:hypothetical protein B5M47_03965 [candidate division CPR3 bacterium 4484_211]|uniref:Uncharacterized protein n=1 Tax=candidate division CPR3 bacterium 4484_211 TaxID=1968527 RepID=A0A1W9NVW1_UNCC3|nr:MAG: hypothetical protein B5M47_03965 [candidate division CPR3 bacterium 4484_211]